MELLKSDSLTFNYSDIFFSYLHDNERQCTQMAKNHVLLYVYSGEFTVKEGNNETIIGKGESVFIHRDNRVIMTKQPSAEEYFKGIFLIFKRPFLRSFFQKIDKNKIPTDKAKKIAGVIRLNNSANIDSLFQSMLPYFNKTTIPPEELMELKLQEGVYSLLNVDPLFYQSLFDFSEPWKIDIMEYLEQNFMYELSIEEIAHFTGRSLATFKRDFSKISDITPQQWLIQRRLKEAYEQLKEGRKRVKDIYAEVGFKNQSHFSLAFKKKYGYSPGR